MDKSEVKEKTIAVLPFVNISGNRDIEYFSMAQAIRVTAQLIQVKEDFHFWSETWGRKLENVFEIQDEVSLHITEKRREQYGQYEIQEHLVDKQTNNFSSYEYALKAKFIQNNWDFCKNEKR
ncbi:MAG: hypothetical protein K9H64_11385 [Bacteroidales bacterium]|nr:hypothetical protein [Bacteroidales bacterium]MCF8456554.1 hypothetical protein [Bacteroidales bacterium]